MPPVGISPGGGRWGVGGGLGGSVAGKAMFGGGGISSLAQRLVTCSAIR